MNIEEQYRKPNLASEPLFYFNSNEMEANISFVKEKNIKSLMLIPNENGYNLKDVSFLEELPFIKNLYMGACEEVTDYGGLSFLTNLENLGISPNKKAKVDLSNLVNLKKIGFLFTPKIKGLHNLVKIEEIRVWSANKNFLNIDVFKNYKELKDLKLVQSIIENELSFLKDNTKLESIEFDYMKRAFSIEGIQYLKNNLKKLNFSSSKKIDNIHLVSQLVNLESLGFIESVKLENAKILEPLKKLKAFGMYGSSSFIDGDLTSLKEMRDTIEHFKIQNKKHYFYE
jgi:hypothetical protein